MNLTELQDSVYTITNRPDLASETLLAVQKATIRAHGYALFPKDLIERWMAVTVDENVFQISLPARFRKWKYVRPTDAQVTPMNYFLNLVSSSDIFDSYAVMKQNVYYNAGDVVNIRVDPKIKGLLLGYYRYPDVTVAAYNSFIARDFPWIIIEESAYAIFASTGNLEMAKYYRQAVDGLPAAGIMGTKQQLLAQELIEGDSL